VDLVAARNIVRTKEEGSLSVLPLSSAVEADPLSTEMARALQIREPVDDKLYPHRAALVSQASPAERRSHSGSGWSFPEMRSAFSTTGRDAILVGLFCLQCRTYAEEWLPENVAKRAPQL